MRMLEHRRVASPVKLVRNRNEAAAGGRNGVSPRSAISATEITSGIEIVCEYPFREGRNAEFCPRVYKSFGKALLLAIDGVRNILESRWIIGPRVLCVEEGLRIPGELVEEGGKEGVEALEVSFEVRRSGRVGGSAGRRDSRLRFTPKPNSLPVEFCRSPNHHHHQPLTPATREPARWITRPCTRVISSRIREQFSSNSRTRNVQSSRGDSQGADTSRAILAVAIVNRWCEPVAR